MGNKYIMRNCYWRHEYQDMNATVPTCDYYGRYGSCLCSDECEHYISEQEAENVIRKRVEAGHSHEDGQWFDLTEALTVERNDWIPREHFDVLKKNYDMLAGLLEDATAEIIKKILEDKGCDEE